MKLRLRNITKQFPGVLANDRVSISVDRGEVLGLLGENGAGKSTLMNILAGLYRPDEGEIVVDEEVVTLSDPAEAIALGIGMIHQHFMLVPVFDVVEAIALGAETSRGPLGRFDKQSARRRIEELATTYGLFVDLDARIEDLPVGVRQRVEILKALYRKSDILVLDEPSAVLTPQETEELFAIIRSLAAGGTSVIFITHKLHEVLEVADRITVLRRGKVVGTTTPSEATSEMLAEMMVGRGVKLTVERGQATPSSTVLEVKALTVRDERGRLAVDGVSFELRAGEIFAIAGVQGNGQTELVEALTGLRPIDSGFASLNGTSLPFGSPRKIADLGVAHIPEDRSRDGMIKGMSVAENLIINSYHRGQFSQRGILNLEAIGRNAVQAIGDFDVRTPSADVMLGTLSGGNQQKVILAREFSRDVRLVIAAQPTRGLDVGSIEYIHRRIVERRDRGAAVLIVSTELDEVFALGDRIAVMFRGRLVGLLDGASATRERVGLLMGGALQ
ncbi:MAG: ABC transporter ATP-binding protein [Candidatus Limnocylindrus sp.]